MINVDTSRKDRNPATTVTLPSPELIPRSVEFPPNFTTALLFLCHEVFERDPK